MTLLQVASCPLPCLLMKLKKWFEEVDCFRCMHDMHLKQKNLKQEMACCSCANPDTQAQPGSHAEWSPSHELFRDTRR